MEYTAERRTKRYELENKSSLTPAERLLLAALNDLRDAEESGKDIPQAVNAVNIAEKAVKQEGKQTTETPAGSIDEIPAGGVSIRTVQATQENSGITAGSAEAQARDKAAKEEKKSDK